jgi:hypothetical protein
MDNPVLWVLGFIAIWALAEAAFAATVVVLEHYNFEGSAIVLRLLAVVALLIAFVWIQR